MSSSSSSSPTHELAQQVSEAVLGSPIAVDAASSRLSVKTIVFSGFSVVETARDRLGDEELGRLVDALRVRADRRAYDAMAEPLLWLA